MKSSFLSRKSLKLGFLTFGILLLSLICLIPNKANAAAFTASVTGNWNDGATWGNTSPGVEGTDYPSTAGGDTVTINGQKTVTIPSGHSARATVTALNAGLTGTHTKLIINGSLRIEGTMTLNNFVELNMGPGATFDLDNNIVALANSSSIWLSWLGTSGSRSVVKSTTAGGRFTSGTANVDINWTYLDISGLGNSVVGSGTTATQNINISHITATDYGDLQILNNSMNAASTFLVEYSDFRNPTGTSKYLLHAFLVTTATTALRKIQYSTFDGGTVQGVLATRSSMIVDNCVFMKTVWKSYGLSGQILSNSFHWNPTETTGPLLDTVVAGPIFSSNYIYATSSNAHPISIGSASSTVLNNVFEGTNDNINFILEATFDATILNNLAIGANFFVRHGVAGSTVTSLYNNTVVGANNNSPDIEALLAMTETSDTLTGTATIKDNLTYNTNTGTNQYGVSLDVATADQVDYADYNFWFGTPGGDVYDHYRNVVITGISEGAAGFGGNDRVVDPNFVDSSRTIASWDTSLGGPGTAAHAVAEMLKLNGTGGTFNTNYTVTNLLAYVKAGFHPQAAALRAAGDSGQDIGALSVSNTAPSLTYGSIAASNSGNVTIPYILTDADSDTVSLTVQYSTDNAIWSTATRGSGGDAITGLSSSSGGTSHSFIWATATDLPSTAHGTVWIKITPSDGGGGLSAYTSNSFAVDNTPVVVASVSTETTSVSSGGGRGVAFIPLKFFQSSAIATSFNFTRGLERGQNGNDVKTLQQILSKDTSVYPEGLVTGYFGPLTEKAVKRFQIKYKIAKEGNAGYGYVGPKTRAKIKEMGL